VVRVSVDSRVRGVEGLLLWGATLALRLPPPATQLRTYTILPLPILHGVWHTQGGRGGFVYCGIDVQQYCNSAGNAGGRGQYTDD